MSRAKFDVTYEIAAYAGFDDSGFISEGSCLRDALSDFNTTRTDLVGGVECIECDSWPVDRPRWIRVCNGREFQTGDQESRSLHIPETVSRSSARRIARLAGAKL